MRASVVGGSASGMLTALLLARAGHDVTLFETDGLKAAADVEQAAAAAFRPTAPQIVQPHAVMARCRELLVERLPDIHAALLAAGVVDVPIADWMPGTVSDRRPKAGDDRLRPMMTRRSTFDWVLRRAVLNDPLIHTSPRTRVLGLATKTGRPLRVVGVRTQEGEVGADLVVDATGRRSHVDHWLTDIGAPPSIVCSEASGVTYFSRHYRIRPGATLPGLTTTRIVAALDEFTLAIFGGDNETFQLAVVPLTGDQRFHGIRDPSRFDAVLRTVPAAAAWLDVLEPLTAVFPMGGPRNTLRRLVRAGRPPVTGLFAVGDSVCTTNPTFGRGLSLAIWGAADLIDILAEHPDDPVAQSLAADAAISLHVEPYYREQAAVDSARLAGLRHTILGEPLPVPLLADPERITFSQLRAAASFDANAFRTFWKLMFMLCHPDEIYADREIAAHVHNVLKSNDVDLGHPRGHFDPLIASPSRDDLLAALGVA